MNNWIRKVKRFQDKFELEDMHWHNFNSFGCEELLKLRKRLVNEENGEFNVAIAKLREKIKDLAKNEDFDATQEIDELRIEILDAICDSIYVLIGTALKLDMDIDGAFDEIHRSNMSKLFRDGMVYYDEGGKVLKGEDFKSPDLRKYI